MCLFCSIQVSNHRFCFGDHVFLLIMPTKKETFCQAEIIHVRWILTLTTFVFMFTRTLDWLILFSESRRARLRLAESSNEWHSSAFQFGFGEFRRDRPMAWRENRTKSISVAKRVMDHDLKPKDFRVFNLALCEWKTAKNIQDTLPLFGELLLERAEDHSR